MPIKNLQTGSIRGHFNRHDKHPVLDRVFCAYYICRRSKKVRERWLTVEAMETAKDEASSRYTKYGHKHRPKKCERCRYSNTSLPHGFFARGDKHPFMADRVFRGYEGDFERWVSVGQMDKLEVASADRRHKSRTYKGETILSDHEVGVMEEIYKYRARLQSCTGIKFHVDHTIPVTKGGRHHHSNLEVVPAIWNLKKNNRNSERWIKL